MGGGSQRGPLPWNRPGPVGLRGVQPPLPPGGREGQVLGGVEPAKATQVCCCRCFGCGLHFELACLLANSATATSCQHMAPVTESLARDPSDARPAQTSLRARGRLNFTAACPDPLRWPSPQVLISSALLASPGPPPPASPLTPPLQHCHTPPRRSGHICPSGSKTFNSYPP